MPVETELKLRISPESLARLKRHALLKSYAVTRPVTRRLYNIYFDTPKLALHQARIALRLRRVGRQWIQTLKGGGSIRAGLHQRNEWEVNVRRPELDFTSSEVDWDAYLPHSLRKKLHPVFVTDFSRSTRILSYPDGNSGYAEIELCMDQGQISTQQLGVPLCEIELELKSGNPRQLFELALEMLEIVPLELEVVNKAEYGYRLLSGYTGTPVKAGAPVVAGDEQLDAVLQMLLWSCLQHLQANLRGAMASDDAEYLHQMRVALRRLRVVLRMAEKLHADEQLAALNSEVAALCNALGKIREWDVFIAQTLVPICHRMAGHAGLQAMLANGMRQRAECYVSLRSDSRARDLQRLILRFSIWMNGSYWTQFGSEAPQARDFATRRLGKLAERFARAVKETNSIDAEQLHTVRILAKKLRYSTEFFAGYYHKKHTRSFLEALSSIQEVLGQINDVAVAHRLLDEQAGESELAAHQEAITLAKGWIAHDLSDQFAALNKAVKHFNKQRAFWN